MNPLPFAVSVKKQMFYGFSVPRSKQYVCVCVQVQRQNGKTQREDSECLCPVSNSFMVIASRRLNGRGMWRIRRNVEILYN